MIDQLYYIFVIAFYSLFGIFGVTIYFRFKKLFGLINMNSSSLPPIDSSSALLETYKERLIAYRVKTKNDLNKMTPLEVTSLYLKHEQDIVNSMSDQVAKIVNKAYTKTMSKMLLIDEEPSLENTLNKDAVSRTTIEEHSIP